MAEKQLRILYVTSEVYPLAETGGVIATVKFGGEGMQHDFILGHQRYSISESLSCFAVWQAPALIAGSSGWSLL